MAQWNQQRMFVSAGVVVIAVGILMVGIFVPGNRKAATPGDEAQDARGGERSTGTAMSLHAAAALGDTESLRDALAGDERIDAMYAGDDPAMAQMTPIMLAAQTHGWCVPTGRHEQSRRGVNHARPLAVWRSLIVEQA